jgi:hypothetical protein
VANIFSPNFRLLTLNGAVVYKKTRKIGLILFYLILATKTKASSRRDMCLKQRVQRKFMIPNPSALCRCAVRKASGAREPPNSKTRRKKRERAQVETNQKH